MTKTALLKTLSILITFAMLLTLLPGGFIVAHAESGKCGDDLTWSLNNETLTISGTGDMYNNYSTSSSAPWKSKSFSTVIISRGVTNIGHYAFYDCTGLTSVTIPDSVTIIGQYAFSGCAGLTSVTIPDSVTSIGYEAFYGCTGLTSVTIPDSVTSIGNYAFYGCTGLTSVTIGNSVTSIGNRAFVNTGYYNNASNWLNKALYIGKWIIEAKTNISGVYSIKDGTVGIADRAFEDCTKLTRVTIPNGVTSIGWYAFSGCTGLTSVTIPDSVTSIKYGAFVNTGYYNNASNWLNKVLYIGKWIIEAKTDIYGAYSIKDGIVGIAPSAFSGCTDLTRVTIPDGVTSIGNGAFYNCRELESATIPDSVTSIGSSVFFGCTRLTSVTIPDSVTSIGYDAFRASGLTSISIPDSVTSIGDSAFRDCTGLKSVTIPDSVTSIGGSAFSDCTGLKSVVIPDSVTSISNSAFFNSGLTSVTIPDSVTSIGGSAFYGCTGLTSVYITDIAAWCNISFSDYYSNPLRYAHNLYLNRELITDLVIPGSVTSIGDYAFNGCTGLTSVTIGNGVTSIGDSVFSGCRKLTSVMIPDSVISIDDRAFYDCSGAVFTVYKNSYAHEYAVSNMLNFVFVPPERIEITQLPNKLTYIAGKDELDVSGGRLKFYYDNGTSEETDMTLSIVSGFDNTKPGTQSLTVTYEGKTTTFNVTIIATTSISIVQLPDKLEYVLNKDQLDVTGGKVKVGYDNGKYETLDMTADMISGFDNNTPGPAALTVAQGGVSATFAVVFYGVCGDDLLWTKPDDDTVVFTGSGDMYDYNSGNAVPWGADIKTVEFDPDMTSIGAYTFTNCKNLTSVTIPNGVTSIGYAAFSGCTGLTKITIPDRVTDIGGSAFENCNSIITLAIPATVERIGAKAFFNCRDLSIISIAGKPLIGADAFKNTSYYNNDMNWQRFEAPLDNTFETAVFKVLYIDSCLIYFSGGNLGTKRIKNYELPNGTGSIADKAFLDATLLSITIPSTVKAIGENTFSNFRDITLYLFGNSYAHKYAKRKELKYTLIGFVSLGDADGDGAITVGDALSALRVAARIVPVTDDMLDCCDIDGDGKVTVGDALSILRVAARIVDSL